MAAILYRRLSVLLRAARIQGADVAAAARLAAMGQSPGTHWYHAHKHGSTAINVGNGMVGAFIIEGPSYDGPSIVLRRYQVNGQPWNTQPSQGHGAQPAPDRAEPAARRGRTAPDFVVNGLRQPQVTMRPGEVQLWRIVNGVGPFGGLFPGAEGRASGARSRRTACSSPTRTTSGARTRPIYVAPGNRIDLLVQGAGQRDAGQQAPFEVRIQNVMARGGVLPIPARPTPDRSGPERAADVGRGDRAAGAAGSRCRSFRRRRTQPAFLADITDAELSPPSLGHQPDDVRFARRRRTPAQHTINNQQFSTMANTALVNVPVNVAQEWTIQNSTATAGPGLIDHPFHIHINPFQITELFDPNENFIDANRRADRAAAIRTTAEAELVHDHRCRAGATTSDRSRTANACSIRQIRAPGSRACRMPPAAGGTANWSGGTCSRSRPGSAPTRAGRPATSSRATSRCAAASWTIRVSMCCTVIS